MSRRASPRAVPAVRSSRGLAAVEEDGLGVDEDPPWLPGLLTFLRGRVSSGSSGSAVLHGIGEDADAGSAAAVC